MRHSMWWSLQNQQSEYQFLQGIRPIFCRFPAQKNVAHNFTSNFAPPPCLKLLKYSKRLTRFILMRV